MSQLAHNMPAPAGLLPPTQALDRFRPRLGDFVQRAEVRSDLALRHGFRVGTLRLLIGERVGSEVVEAGGVAPIPRTPPWLLGVMNLRGRPVPVFDLRVALGLADQEGSRRRLVLVLDKGERAVGIDIDEFPAPLRGLQRANAVPTLPARLAAFVAAAWVGQRTLWLDFEHRGFFDSLAGESGT